MPNEIDFFSNMTPKMTPKIDKNSKNIARKLHLGTTSGTIRLQVPFQNSPLLFQNSCLMMFHDL